MKRVYTLYLLGLLLLSGCVVRTYPVTKERVDQDLGVGNRGYLAGRAPQGQVKERKATRTTQIVEIELHPPIKFEKMPKPQEKPEEPKKVSLEKSEDEAIWGNRGFITQGAMEQAVVPVVNIEKYTVQKGDTLQKISQRFYGTTKKWNKIYEANKEKLKSPNKIYPGQVIGIPTEPLNETKENLK